MAAISLRFFGKLLWVQQLQQLDLLSGSDSLHFPRVSAGVVEWGRACNLNVPTQPHKKKKGSLLKYICVTSLVHSLRFLFRCFWIRNSHIHAHIERYMKWESQKILIWVWAFVLSWWAQEVLDNMSSVDVVLTTVEIRTGLTMNRQWEWLPKALNTQQTWWKTEVANTVGTTFFLLWQRT